MRARAIRGVRSPPARPASCTLVYRPRDRRETAKMQGNREPAARHLAARHDPTTTTTLSGRRSRRAGGCRAARPRAATRGGRRSTRTASAAASRSRSPAPREQEKKRRREERGALSLSVSRPRRRRAASRATPDRSSRARTSRARASAACSWLATSRESERPSASAYLERERGPELHPRPATAPRRVRLGDVLREVVALLGQEVRAVGAQPPDVRERRAVLGELAPDAVLVVRISKKN